MSTAGLARARAGDNAARQDRPWLLFAGAGLFWAVLILWQGPLSELHDFRQSQTAVSAYWMVQTGIDLMRPPLGLFGGEHMSAPLEFPLFQAVTALLARALGWDSGTGVVLAGRLVNFAAFLLAGVALYRLVALLHGPALAETAAALFLFLPFPVFWSSTVMIEYSALAVSLAWVEVVCRVALKGERGLALLAWGAVAGTLALLIKVTTGLAYGPALAGLWVYWVTRTDRPSWTRIAVASCALAVVPLAIGYAWVEWSDAVKMESPLTMFLTAAGSTAWNFGTLAERMMPSWWAKIFGYWVLQIYAVIGVPFALWGAWVLWRSQKWLLALWASVPATGVLVFFALYQHHDYYHLAVIPGLLVPMAAGVRMAAARMNGARRDAYAIGAVVVLAWLSIYAQSFLPTVNYARDMLTAFRFGPAFESPIRKRDMEMADLIRAHSGPSDVVMIDKGDWSAIVALTAERRALMLSSCGDLNIAPKPHVDLYVIDRTRSVCGAMRIDAACRIADVDGIGVGRCLAP